MNTPEVIAILSHPNECSIFVNENQREIERNTGGIAWTDTGVAVVLNKYFMSHTWELVREPVTFMGAVNSGKKIRFEHWEFYYTLNDALELLSNNPPCMTEEMINGKWYIE